MKRFLMLQTGELLVTIGAGALWAVAFGALLFLAWPLARRHAPDDGATAAAYALLLAFAAICSGVTIGFFIGLEHRWAYALVPHLLLLLSRPWRRPDGSFPRPGFFFLASILAVSLPILAIALIVPSHHYDAFLYHLPTAALAWQEKSLWFSAAHPQVGTNPILAELPKVWAFAITGNDQLASLQQLPFWLGLGAITRAFARSLAAPAIAASLATLGTLLAPKAIEQAASANVDLFTGFLGALSIWAIARGQLRWAAAAALLFAQTKYPALPPALLLAATLLVLYWRRGRRREAIAFAVAFATFGGFTEWKNLWLRGNPTYPYQWLVDGEPPAALSALAPKFFVRRGEAGQEKWAGYFINEVESASSEAAPANPVVKYWQAWGDRYAVPYDALSGRWGPTWFLWAVPGFFLFLLLGDRQKFRAQHTACWIAFGLQFVTVKSWEARFAFLLLPFGFGAMAWALGHCQLKMLQRAAMGGIAFTLAWAALQAAIAHPPHGLLFEKFSRFSPASLRYIEILPFTSRDPQLNTQLELARAVHEHAPSSLWIEFAQGETHAYGWAPTLLYPFFARDWSRRIEVRDAAASGQPHREDPSRSRPEAVLLQRGPDGRLPRRNLEQLGYRLVIENQGGALYVAH